MTTFEEQFPEIEIRFDPDWNDDICEMEMINVSDGGYIGIGDVSNFCLSKQKVREALNTIPPGYAHRVLKELGL